MQENSEILKYHKVLLEN